MLLISGVSVPGVASLVSMLLISLPALQLVVLLRRLNLAFLTLIFILFSMMMRSLFQTIVLKLLVSQRWGRVLLLLRRALRVIFNFW